MGDQPSLDPVRINIFFYCSICMMNKFHILKSILSLAVSLRICLDHPAASTVRYEWALLIQNIVMRLVFVGFFPKFIFGAPLLLLLIGENVTKCSVFRFYGN